jgi:DNA-binding MarR family transcriptional regulator
MTKSRRAQLGSTRTITVDDAPLSRVLAQVERHISRNLEETLAGQPLTIDQWRLLDLLADGEGHPMSELAAALVVPGPTLTKIVDKVVDRALVHRLVDDRDRRRVLAFLSDKGKEVHQTLAPVIARTESETLACLGADSVVLVSLLERIAQHYQASSTRR